jgi:hypothetical protein
MLTFKNDPLCALKYENKFLIIHKGWIAATQFRKLSLLFTCSPTKNHEKSYSQTCPESDILLYGNVWQQSDKKQMKNNNKKELNFYVNWTETLNELRFALAVCQQIAKNLSLTI